MDFDAVLAQVREQLAREKRIAYRILKRQYQQPRITWAKLQATAEGARLALRLLW